MSLLVKPKRLILSEMGYLSLDSFAATCLVQLVSERYEKSSIILTSNKSHGDWGSIFADNLRAARSERRRSSAQWILGLGYL
jgi:DNA replication protein DnaC